MRRRIVIGYYEFWKFSDKTLFNIMSQMTESVAQWAGAFASQGEGWVFESQQGLNLVVKTGSDSHTDTHSNTCECHRS